MAQQSWRRVLGETSLERKCRLLFGFWLTLLISGAFWGVEKVSSDLILKNTRTTARDVVDIALLKPHFNYWETREDKQGFADLLGEQLARTDGRNNHEVIVQDEESKPKQIPNVRIPGNAQEVNILEQLEKMLDERRAAELAQGQVEEGLPERNVPDVDISELFSVEDVSDQDRPIFVERVAQDINEYQYYEPVRWGNTCTICHSEQTPGVEGAGQGTPVDGAELPFTVIKVKIPYEETQSSIHKARAILIAVAIVTVFVSMIALYVIIRLLVVRPLKHLRDVSDRISHGDLESRAEILTDDEFEELGTSFNKMVRHLTETQDELKTVNADLDLKVDEMAQLNMQLFDMNRMKDEFMANMSHELRTPLNSIIGFSEVLQGVDALNDKQHRYASNIQRSGQILLEMINEILDLAKIEAGKQEINPVEMNLHLVTSAQCDLVKSLVEEKNLSLEISEEMEDPMVFQDQGKIQQVLTNLLSNAIKFTPEGGRITVRLEESKDLEDFFVIRVIDTGIGIAEEDREVIFEKFRQGNVSSGQDNLTREYAGTGLGLSIVKEICRMLGGEVSVESQLGIGSIFTVMLPKETTPVQPEAKSDINHRVDQLNRGQTDLSLKPTSSQPVGEQAFPANPEESLSDSREVDIDAMADETNLSQHEPLKDDPQA
ncbi:MAG: two-component sensor histidine kinase [Rhodopirellula sp.]|nr:two-component sensor histidine kinase [Rhodopirellula sp.]|tara:strand:- start:884 stop:2866 length:1983 start_codon:yes stop_codon:yes gene_type:complete